MLTLLNDEYAPITSSVGFLECPLSSASQALIDWRGDLYGPAHVRVIPTSDPFPQVLSRLEPLTGGTPPRELLISTDSGWTAYFDCFIQGPDPTSSIGLHLTQVLRCRGVTVRNIPHTWDGHGGRIGSVQFQMFGPEQTEFLNYIRAVEVTHDGRRWIFNQSGKVQEFEHPDRYSAKSVPARFPAELLDEYCQALGIRYFDPYYYSAEGIMVESRVPASTDAIVMSLTAAQRWLGMEAPRNR